MAKSKTYELALKIAGKMDSSLRDACTEADKNLSTLGTAAKKAAKIAATALAGVATAAAGVAVSSLNTYAEFEKAMDGAAVTARASEEEYALMEAAARKMGATTTKTATEAAEAMGYMALAGWNVEQSMAGLEPMLRLSEATNMDLARASDLATDSMSALGLGVEDMTDYLDLAVQAQRASNTTAEALMEAFIGCGGAARTAGVDMGDLSTALGILANNGTKGAEAGTAMNAMINRMTSKDVAIKAMKQMGVSVYDAAGEFRGLETILTDVSGAMASMTTQEKMGYLAKIAGTNYATEMSYLLAATSKDAAAAEEFLRAAGLEGDALAEALANTSNAWSTLETDIMDHSGVLLEVAKANTDNLAGATDIFKSAVAELQMKIGEQLAPYAREGLEYLANEVLPVVTKQMGELIPRLIEGGKALWENRNTILAVVGAAVTAVAAFKGLKVASAAMGAVKNLSTIFKAGAKSGNLLTKVLGMGNVKLALIAGVIAAVAAGFVLLWNKSERFRETVMALWGKLQMLGKALTEMAGAIWSKAAPVLELLGNALLNGLERAVELLAPVIDNVIGIFTGLANFVTGVFSGDWNKAMQGLKSIFGNVLGAMGNLAKAGFTAILEIGTAIWPAIDGAVQAGIAAISSRFPMLGAALSGVWTSIQDCWANIQAIFSNIIGFIDNVFSGNWSAAWENVVAIFGNVFGLIGNLVKAPINAVISAINWVLDKVNSISVTIPDWVPGVGGKTLGFAIPTIPQLEVGGIATKPTLAEIGEGGEPEAVLPLSKLAAMLDIWSGKAPGDGSGPEPQDVPPPGWERDKGQQGDGGQVVFAPVFHFYGQTSKEEAKEAAKISFEEFKQLWRRLQAEDRRKSFNPA